MAFGRINGNVCGFIANSDTDITGAGAKKAARFVELLDAFNIPVVTLANCGGTKFDVEAEQDSLIRDAARLISAYAQAGIPKHPDYGQSSGDGFAVLCPKALGADMVYAWPNAEISSMPSEAGALVL